MRGKRIMCLLGSINMMLTPFNVNTLTPVSAMQIIEKQVDLNEMVHIKNGIIKKPIEIQFKKDKAEFEKKKAEELKQQELKILEEEKAKKEKEKQEEDNKEWKTFVLTFYTSLAEENSGQGTKSVTCTGGKLYDGLVASNYYNLNTKIHLDSYGEVTVGDHGGSNFNNDYRLDVYVPRNNSESETHYFNRVNRMGQQKVRGYIIK